MAGNTLKGWTRFDGYPDDEELDLDTTHSLRCDWCGDPIPPDTLFYQLPCDTVCLGCIENITVYELLERLELEPTRSGRPEHYLEEEPYDDY